MLLALVGITGVGKTYYSDKIAEKLCFNKVKTIRTRKIREGEQNGKTGLFMTQDELSKLEEEGKIFVIRPLVKPVSRMERDADTLQGFYEHGYELMKQEYERLQKYMECEG